LEIYISSVYHLVDEWLINTLTFEADAFQKSDPNGRMGF